MRKYTKDDVKAACFAENFNDRINLSARWKSPTPTMNNNEQAMYKRAQEIDGRLLSCPRHSTQDDEKTIIDWMRPNDVIISEVVYNPVTGNIIWIAGTQG